MHDAFQEAQAADLAKTSKRAPIEAIANPFVSEVESVQDGMTTIGINKSTKSTPESKLESDLSACTVTPPKGSAPVVEIKKGKQEIIIL